MAKERLSKLQKWILTECYKHKNEHYPNGAITRWKLVDMFNKITPSVEVSISRSIRSLIDKKYIEGLCSVSVGNMAMIYGMMGKSKEEIIKDLVKYKTRERLLFPFFGFGKIKLLVLTNKGSEKAQKLLMLDTVTGDKT
jgi:hypothetical protein